MRLVTSPSRPAHSSTSLKCGSASTVVEHAAVGRRLHRRTVHVVQQALDQVGGRREVLQALLILDADGVASEVVGDAQGGDVHLALLQDLVVGQARSPDRGQCETACLAHPATDARACASSSVTHCISAYSADWLRRSLKTPVGCSSSSGMMALYMPMQPSSKMPRMALLRRRSALKAPADFLGARRQLEVPERAHVAGIVLHRLTSEPTRVDRREKTRRENRRSTASCTARRPWSATR